MKAVSLPPMKVLGRNGFSRRGRVEVTRAGGQLRLSVFCGTKNERYPQFEIVGPDTVMWKFVEELNDAAASAKE